MATMPLLLLHLRCCWVPAASYLAPGSLWLVPSKTENRKLSSTAHHACYHSPSPFLWASLPRGYQAGSSSSSSCFVPPARVTEHPSEPGAKAKAHRENERGARCLASLIQLPLKTALSQASGPIRAHHSSTAAPAASVALPPLQPPM